ncbi:flippase-like domain-containing protein [bacterium]|nr:flippase-like domain-containing protein [bacterium]
MEFSSKLPDSHIIPENGKTALRFSRGFKISRFLWLLAIPALWWALRLVPFQQIAATIVKLTGWQILILVALNLGVIVVFSLRWWVIVRAMGGKLPFSRAVAYHQAGFGVSYFTAGPQVGGEPLQVMLVTQNHPVKLPTAVSSVFLDKVFELLTNFTFLVFGTLLIFSRNGNDVLPGGGWWAAGVVLLALPLLHLLALRKSIFPVSNILARLPSWKWLQKISNLVAESEQNISRLLQSNPRVILLAAVISVIGWLLIFSEYILLVRFLGGQLSVTQVVTAFLASQLAFLTPLPGGLGALEASQMLAFTSFGAPAALGLSVSLLMRARDMLFGLMGLALAGTAMNKRFAQTRAAPAPEE